MGVNSVFPFTNIMIPINLDVDPITPHLAKKIIPILEHQFKILNMQQYGILCFSVGLIVMGAVIPTLFGESLGKKSERTTLSRYIIISGLIMVILSICLHRMTNNHWETYTTVYLPKLRNILESSLNHDRFLCAPS